MLRLRSVAVMMSRLIAVINIRCRSTNVRTDLVEKFPLIWVTILVGQLRVPDWRKDRMTIWSTVVVLLVYVR